MSATSSHYKTLRVKIDATDDEIRSAYKRLILSAHPDKGGSTALFRQLQVAYETLRDKTARREYDKVLLAQRRKKLFKTPAPMSDIKSPLTFRLPNDDEYVFETAPDRLRCRFRHGDVVEDVGSGQRGVFIGLASTGWFWCHQGADHAVPMQTFGGDKDIVVVFRSPTTPMANDSFSRPRPATASPRPQARSSSPLGTSAGAAPGSPSHEHLKAKARAYKAELLQAQRLRVLTGMLSTLQRQEATRRQSLLSEIDDYFLRFHSEMYQCKLNLEFKKTSSFRRPSVAAGMSSGTCTADQSESASFAAPPTTAAPMTPRTPRTPGPASGQPPRRSSSMSRPYTPRAATPNPVPQRRTSAPVAAPKPTATPIVPEPWTRPTPNRSEEKPSATTTTSSSSAAQRYSVPINPKLVASSRRPGPIDTSSGSFVSHRARSPLAPYTSANADTKARIHRMTEDAAALREELKRANHVV